MPHSIRSDHGRAPSGAVENMELWLKMLQTCASKPRVLGWQGTFCWRQGLTEGVQRNAIVEAPRARCCCFRVHQHHGLGEQARLHNDGGHQVLLLRHRSPWPRLAAGSWVGGEVPEGACAARVPLQCSWAWEAAADWGGSGGRCSEIFDTSNSFLMANCPVEESAVADAVGTLNMVHVLALLMRPRRAASSNAWAV